MPLSRLGFVKSLPVLQGGQMMEAIFEIDVDMAKLRRSKSPRQEFFYYAALVARHAIETTGMPRDFFYFEFTEKAQKLFSIPETVPLDGGYFEGVTP